MGDSTIEKITTTNVTPRRSELLHEIRVDKTNTAPLGGLNPYSPHYVTIGRQFHKLLVEHAGLHRQSDILDIGCGTGRLTNQFSNFLNGRYEGFDVHPHFIEYCQTTFKNKNFNFKRLDILHDEYNPTGSICPTKLEFPYKQQSFNLVIAIAVFNHFRTAWVQQYIKEISRVLKPKGIFFGTILLLNKQSIEFINRKSKPPYQFNHRTPESWHDFESRQLFNVAHPEENIRRSFISNNLMIREPIRYGEWCESKIALAGPDVIIAQKN